MKKKSSQQQVTDPLVSILVPIYNVEKFLDQCLASLASQTLREAEFICLNDGSTDGSLAIINSFIKRDQRFKLLDKSNSGYGDSMNQGLKIAKGKYIGIVESDDWAEPNMFTDLVKLAEDNQAQAVKSNFFFYSSRGGGSSKKYAIVDPDEVGTIVSPRQMPHIFAMISTIWSGLYNRQFLLDNKIEFLPTPGASYQDTGFNFKVWAAATRAIYTNQAYLHYRIDNEQSSVKSRAKVFCVCDEFASIRDYLVEHKLMDQLKAVYTQSKFKIYFWNLTRLEGRNLTDFTNRMSEEFTADQTKGYLDISRLDNKEASRLRTIMTSSKRFLLRSRIKWLLRLIHRIGIKAVGGLFRFKMKRAIVNNELSGTVEINDDSINLLQEKLLTQPTKYLDNNITKQPSISIIVPAYNSERYLPKTLDSLLAQTLANIEIICIDDGSSDGTLELLKQYAKKDQRIRVYHQKNAGVAAARNTGLDRAKGKYIMWCDSDDTFTSNMCQKMYNIITRRQVDLAACSQNIVYDGLKKKLHKNTDQYLEHKYHGNQLITWELISKTDVSLWNKIFRRDIIEQNKIRCPEGLLFEDAYFCNAYFLSSQTIYYTNAKLYNYTRQPGSIMSTSFKKHKSSADYLKITAATYEFLRERGLYQSYADFFWLRMIQDFCYAYDNQGWSGRRQAEVSVRQFIVDHYDDYQLASPGMRKALDRVLSRQSVIKVRQKIKHGLSSLYRRLSQHYSQQLKALKYGNIISGQDKYINYLIKKQYR